ncbi:hypothetical protein [Photobacterium carnosum]|uniref:hypothetical protein n=1 Tax=Photobacterium carnosum TaxID=2023717 RepID=UPI001E489BA8|nr:hypothetical protein [Photobacterium carnosum]MCD9500319.1 hypothetical protein [Photobacterium carnosum]
MKMIEKIIALTLLGTISNVANAAVEDSAVITITGSINAANICSLNIDGGAILDAGATNVVDLSSSGGDLSVIKSFNATVTCTLPTAIAVKFTSSLPANPALSSRLGEYKTSTNKTAAYLYANLNPSTPPTTNGVTQSYAAIGNIGLSSVSVSDTFTPITSVSDISGVSGDSRNVYTVINTSNNPISSTNFILPFSLVVRSDDISTGWTADIVGGIFSLSSTVTLELHSI